MAKPLKYGQGRASCVFFYRSQIGFLFELVLNALLTAFVYSMLALQQLGHYGIDDDVAALKRDKHVLMMELVRLRQQQQVYISMSRSIILQH